MLMSNLFIFILFIDIFLVSIFFINKVPTIEQVNALSKELRSRATIPVELFIYWCILFIVADHVYKAINALPITTHPMTEFTTGVMALQVQSEFAKAYENGIHKSKWVSSNSYIFLRHLFLMQNMIYIHIIMIQDTESQHLRTLFH
uniref:Uncharacterized protein n=1 Tax=Lactuca sativa TaxID=4236 RepID=A0A9R1VPP0_LACSA|nr:hypothetical protein LSAT_V11C400172280 [Lactuca sativa]